MTSFTEPATATSAYEAYLNAIRGGDRRRAFAAIDEAQSSGMSVGQIYLEVFQRALREIGRLWQQNEISVADEHLATAITQAAMARLYERVFTFRPGSGHTLIAACADVERHEIGLRMLRLILVGGRPFVDDPELATRLGADITARDAATAVELLRQRLGG